MSFPPDDEPVGISPRVDCVFKKVLGDPAHTEVLLDFLNAVLQREAPVVAVVIENPANVPEFVGDSYTVLDVRATDAAGETFHVEMQSWNQHALKDRMLYAWADLYKRELVAGKTYDRLRPVVSIWILDENTLPRVTYFHHRFGVWDLDRRVRLTRHLEIHVLELPRWRERTEAAPPGLTRWMDFFAYAEGWVGVPEDLDTPTMETAMAVLQEFRKNREWNDVYRCRLDFQRIQLTNESVLKQAREDAARFQAESAHERAEKERERAEKERERAEKERERAEKERLRERLRALGVDPDGD